MLIYSTYGADFQRVYFPQCCTLDGGNVDIVQGILVHVRTIEEELGDTSPEVASLIV